MKAEVVGSKLIAIIAFLYISTWSFGQVVTSGEIMFERRTNLEKRYEGTQTMGRNKSWQKKPKIDEFILYFTDSTSLFVPQLPAIGDEDREWSTMKNTTFQNFNKDELKRKFSYYGAQIFLSDSLKRREWIITGNRREIAGYETKQALWEANDSTRIYAWYSEQIKPSVGPESFNGLPGAILGLAIEDGGVVYFAKEVKPLSKPKFHKDMPEGKEKDTYNNETLLEMLNELFSDGERGGRIMDDIFIW